MSLGLFVVLVMAGGFGSGVIGALTGLGGGMVLTPLLTLAFGCDFRYAAGASLICVIATSSGAGAAYARGGLANFRIGLFLLVAVCAGALGGASLAGHVSRSALTIIFGAVLGLTALLSMRKRRPVPADLPTDPLAQKLGLEGVEPTAEGPFRYHAQHPIIAFGLMIGAGLLSGLLGIGSGAFKVLAMDEAMRLPFKVSTTTSNFMIGVSAAASAGLYLGNAWIDPLITAPVVIGVLLGARVGAVLLQRWPVQRLRLIFTLVLFILAVQMVWKGVHA
jgi:uncharacterized membrane protein YfcA